MADENINAALNAPVLYFEQQLTDIKQTCSFIERGFSVLIKYVTVFLIAGWLILNCLQYVNSQLVYDQNILEKLQKVSGQQYHLQIYNERLQKVTSQYYLLCNTLYDNGRGLPDWEGIQLLLEDMQDDVVYCRKNNDEWIAEVEEVAVMLKSKQRRWADTMPYSWKELNLKEETIQVDKISSDIKTLDERKKELDCSKLNFESLISKIKEYLVIAYPNEQLPSLWSL